MHPYIYRESEGMFVTPLTTGLEIKSVIKDFSSKGLHPVILCSKDLPVIQIPEEEDELLDKLLPFKVKTSFREEWVAEKKYCYFGIDPNIYAAFEGLDNLIVRHYASVLHEFWLDTERVFHVDFEENFMHFYIKMDGRFLFYNKLAFENVADVHYNIAYVVKEIIQDVTDFTIIFSGLISKDSKIINGLSSYFSNFRFLNDGQDDFIVNENKIESRHFDSFALATCV